MNTPLAPPKLRRRLPADLKPLVSDLHMRMIDEWFRISCVSKVRAATTVHADPKAFNLPEVRREIARRREALADKTGVTEEWLISQLKLIVEANFGDLLEVQEDGNAVLDLNGMTDAHRAALQEFTSETDTLTDDGEQRVTRNKSKVKFASKQAAIEALCRIMGMFKDRVEVNGMDGLVDRIAEARRRVSGAKADGPDQK